MGLKIKMSKKSRKRPSRNNKHGPANKAKQQQLLQKKQQQELQASAEVDAAAATARSKSNSSKPSSATTAGPSAKSRPSLSVAPSSAISGAGANANAPTGSGPPSRPWDPNHELPTRGLINLGNTCFFNSAMQNVFHTRPLHEALFSDNSGRRQGTYVGPLNKVFRKVLLEMSGEGPSGTKRGAYSPKLLLSAVQRAHPYFKGYHQQDAHELFIRLIGTLEDEEDAHLKQRLEEEEEGEEEERSSKTEEKAAAAKRKGDGEEEEGGASAGASVSGSGVAEVSVGSATVKRGENGARQASIASDEPSASASGSAGIVSAGADNSGDAPMQDGVVATPGADGGLSALNKDLEGVREENEDKETKPFDREAEGLEGASEELAANEGAGTGESETPPADNHSSTLETACTATENDTELAIAHDEGDATAAAVEARGDEVASDDALAGAPGKSNSIRADPDVNSMAACENGEGSDGADGLRIDGVKSDHHERVTIPSTGGESKVLAARVAVNGNEGRAESLESRKKRKSESGRACGGEKETSTDDGETTDAGDYEDEDDENGRVSDFAATAAAPPPPPNRADPSVSSSAADVAAVEETEEENNGGAPEDMPATSALPRCAAVTEVFGGSLCSVVTCSGCGERSFSMEPTVCLSLGIPLTKAAQEHIKNKRKSIAAGRRLSSTSAMGEGRPGGSAASEGQENASENLSPGFELSAKEKRKLARQERGRQKSMDMEAQADGDGGGDTDLADRCARGGIPAREDTDRGDDVAETSGDESISAQQTAEEREDVRQCLEYVIQVACVMAEDGGASQGAAPCADAELAQAGGGGMDGTGKEITPDAEERKKDEKAAESAIVSEAEEASVDEGTTQDSICASGSGSCAAGDEGVAPATDGEVGPMLERSCGDLTKDPANADQDGQTRAFVGSTQNGDHPPRSPDQTAVTSEVGSHVVEPSMMESSGFTGVGENGGPEKSEEASGNHDEEAGDEGENHEERNRSVEDDADDGARTCSSSESQGGCTTGEAEGSTELRDGESAFGSDCGDGNDADDPAQSAPLNTSSSSQSDACDSQVDTGLAAGPSQSPGGSETGAGGEVGVDGLPGVLVGVGESDSIAPDNGEIAEAIGPSEDAMDGESARSAPANADAVAAAAAKNPLNRLEEPLARVEERPPDPGGVDLFGCLDHFMAEENLVAADGNGYDCEICHSRSSPPDGDRQGETGTTKQDARKRLLMLGKPPRVLVCHLKRLQATKKIIRKVQFPTDLDMAPYYWKDPEAPLSPTDTSYRLFGLVQHRGSRLGGHYVAYVKDAEGWKHATDSNVRPATLPEVKDCEAYMLFYERCEEYCGENAAVVAVATGEESSGGTIGDGDTAPDGEDPPEAVDCPDGGQDEGGASDENTANAEADAEEGGDTACARTVVEAAEGEASPCLEPIGSSTCAAVAAAQSLTGARDGGDETSVTLSENGSPEASGDASSRDI